MSFLKKGFRESILKIKPKYKVGDYVIVNNYKYKLEVIEVDIFAGLVRYNLHCKENNENYSYTEQFIVGLYKTGPKKKLRL